jgi:hypothetical protein
MYYKLDLRRVSELVDPKCVLIDAWGVFDPDAAAEAGLELNTFGRG